MDPLYVLETFTNKEIMMATTIKWEQIQKAVEERDVKQIAALGEQLAKETRNQEGVSVDEVAGQILSMAPKVDAYTGSFLLELADKLGWEKTKAKGREIVKDIKKRAEDHANHVSTREERR